MAEAKAGKVGGSTGCAKTKVSPAKRRASNAQAQARKTPSKAVLKQLAKDWEHVT